MIHDFWSAVHIGADEFIKNKKCIVFFSSCNCVKCIVFPLLPVKVLQLNIYYQQTTPSYLIILIFQCKHYPLRKLLHSSINVSPVWIFTVNRNRSSEQTHSLNSGEQHSKHILL